MVKPADEVISYVLAVPLCTYLQNNPDWIFLAETSMNTSTWPPKSSSRGSKRKARNPPAGAKTTALGRVLGMRGEDWPYEREKSSDAAIEFSIRRSKLTNTDFPSGRKIIEILKKNPDKDPDKYDDDDIAHMRKVAAYCKRYVLKQRLKNALICKLMMLLRHLAQEGKAKQDPDSKSARSLKNWGWVGCYCKTVSGCTELK